MPIMLAPLNQEVRVVKILATEKLKKHLESLGILVNSKLTVLSVVNGGVVVAITKDGKYVVQEGNSAKAGKGGALVVYDTKPGKANSKHIQGFISINKSEDTEQNAQTDEAEFTPVELNDETTTDEAEFSDAHNSYIDEAKALFGDEMLSRSDISNDEFWQIAYANSIWASENDGVPFFTIGSCTVKLVDGKIEIE